MKTFLSAVVCAATLTGAVVTDSALKSAEAAGDSPWLVRVRALGVLPDESATVTPIGGSVSVDEDYVPELDISYFFTDNIAAELVLATTRHKVKSSVAGSLGKVSLLPPTLTLQYHFAPKAQISPYVGAGVNYTVFYDEDGAPGLPIDYDDSFGWALQAGVDFKLNDQWSINLDLKKVFLETDVSIAGGAVTADVELDPWLIGLGIGYRF